MAFDNLLLERDGAIAVVTVNRPKVLNALNAATIAELSRAFAELKADETVRVVILTGAGEKSFVAGADINELAANSGASAQATAHAGEAAFLQIEQLGKPVIAAVNGFALGGGCELAMACTLRVAADSARFGQPEVNLGLIPGYGGTQRLPRLVGKGVALDLLLTGRMVKADEALALGLVNRVVPAADLLTATRALAGELAAKPPRSLEYILAAVHRGADLTLEAGTDLEASLFGVVSSTADMREGTSAFLEKRQAAFTGK
ncbi:MAG: enoyl-CoA hydratase/isomerase family protein [Vicinamibacterales bacterium]